MSSFPQPPVKLATEDHRGHQQEENVRGPPCDTSYSIGTHETPALAPSPRKPDPSSCLVQVFH